MASGKGSSSNSGEGSEQYTREPTDEENLSDRSSDSEDEEVLQAFEPVVPRCGKRTYGIQVEDMLAQRRIKNAKLDEQLAILRSILPGNRQDEREYHVLMDAYQHIVKLQGCVEDLNTQLVSLQTAPATRVNGGTSSPQEPRHGARAQITNVSSVSDIAYERPQVEVKRVNGNLGLQITCVNRPGLLADIIAALDSKSINVLHGSIVCGENVLFQDLILQNYETTVHQADPEAEDEAIKNLIFRAIRPELGSDNSSK